MSDQIDEQTQPETASHVWTRGLPDPIELIQSILSHRGWAQRAGQLEMTDSVAERIWSEHATDGVSVNAPVGTGKTLAYLVAALPSDRKIIVCTSTKALQDQVVGTELPRLAADLKQLFGYNLTYSVLKGRSNYVCLEAANAILTGRSPDPDDDLMFSELASQLETSDITDLRRIVDNAQLAMAPGSKAQLDADDALRALPLGLRKSIGAERRCGSRSARWWETTEGSDAQLGEKTVIQPAQIEVESNCVYRTAYARALQADVLVMNTSLLAAELLKSRVMPDFVPQQLLGAGVVIVDEAHHLVSVLTEALRFKLDLEAVADSVEGLLRKLAKRLPEMEQRFAGGRMYVEAASSRLVDIVDAGDSPISRRSKLRTELFELKSQLQMLVRGLDTDSTMDPALVKPIKRILSTYFEEVLDPLAQGAMILTTQTEPADDTPSELAYELTVENWDQEGVCILMDMVPVDISFFRPELAQLTLERNLFAEDLPWGDDSSKSVLVLCSGTITEETAESVGMPDGLHVDVPSPFDPARSRLMVASNLPRPNDPNWQSEAWEVAREAIKAVGGRTLFLTTSYSNMDGFYQRAVDDIGDLFPLSYQGNGTREEIVRNFTEQETSVHFGTTSYWEGIDIPGKALSLVIIDKIPFPQPDDAVYSARRKWEEKHGRDPFMRVDVDRASVMMAQGTGRLIRKETDLGGVLILDPRVETARYGSAVLKLVPGEMPVTNDLEAFTEWLTFVGQADWDHDELPQPDGRRWRSLRAPRRRRRV